MVAENRKHYDMLKELLKDEGFRKLSGKMPEIEVRMDSAEQGS